MDPTAAWDVAVPWVQAFLAPVVLIGGLRVLFSTIRQVM